MPGLLRPKALLFRRKHQWGVCYLHPWWVRKDCHFYPPREDAKGFLPLPKFAANEPWWILVHYYITLLCIIICIYIYRIEGKHEKKTRTLESYIIYIYTYQPVKIEHILKNEIIWSTVIYGNPSTVVLFPFTSVNVHVVSPGRRAEIPSMIWISSSEIPCDPMMVHTRSGDPHELRGKDTTSTVDHRYTTNGWLDILDI